jgi:hypothetical protein
MGRSLVARDGGRKPRRRPAAVVERIAYLP